MPRSHADTACILVNLGTPSAPTPSAVRRFLRSFLSDPRVVEVPRPLWWLILNLFILPFRPRAVSVKYRAIWWEGGSPLQVITQRQTDAVLRAFRQQWGDRAPRVLYAMSYSDPTLTSVLETCRRDGVQRIILLPLYPQYSATTTAVIFDQLSHSLRQWRDLPSVTMIKHYGAEPAYIDALATSVRDFWAEHGRTERLLLSYHGIPRRNVDLGDPYYRECQETAALLRNALGLDDTQLAVSFQSRLGRAEWLQPYTSDVLEEWGRATVKSVAVLCPAFSADCLETLEEINQEGREIFQHAGGGQFHYIPCLNDQPAHIDMLCSVLRQHLPG